MCIRDSGEGEGLGGRGDRDRALAHAGQGAQREVLPVVGEVLVDLVGDDQEVAGDGELGDGGQLFAGEDHAGGVVGGVEQQQAGAGPDGVGEGVEVGAEVGGAEGEGDPLGSGHGDAGGVGVVEGLEGDDLVARLQEGEHGRGDRLGGAGGDQDFAVGVEGQAVPAPLVLGDCLAQLGDALTGRVLVAAAVHDGAGGGLGDLRGAVGVGEALPEVDGAGARGQGRHLGEDRGAEPFQPPVQQRPVLHAIVPTSRIRQDPTCILPEPRPDAELPRRAGTT